MMPLPSVVLLGVDGEEMARLLQALLTLEGYEVALSSGEGLLDRVQQLAPRAVLLESRGPTLLGWELCARIKGEASLRPTPVALIGEAEEEGRAREIGADAFIPKPVTRKGVVAGLRGCLEEQDRAEALVLSAAARALEVLLEARVPDSWPHSQRVAGYSLLLAEVLKLPQDQMAALSWAGLLHDLGKLGIRDSLLLKAGPLGEGERRELSGHPLLGDGYLSLWLGAGGVREALRHHHERYDGQGYPSGLRGEEIPLFARILAIADCYDAITSDRPYHVALSREEALIFLKGEVGKALDPFLLSLFSSAITRKGG